MVLMSKVHTANLLGDLYRRLGRQEEAAAMAADMERKLQDLLQAADDKVTSAESRLAGLRRRLRVVQGQLVSDAADAARLGQQR